MSHQFPGAVTRPNPLMREVGQHLPCPRSHEPVERPLVSRIVPYQCAQFVQHCGIIAAGSAQKSIARFTILRQSLLEECLDSLPTFPIHSACPSSRVCQQSSRQPPCCYCPPRHAGIAQCGGPKQAISYSAGREDLRELEEDLNRGR
jgi:hypothetical protein